ncbi:MAG: spore coat U domain-containing protein [Pseudomonadota bacterium]|uniref:Fimbrial major subunit CsuA/B family protein n=1 Tax=Ralstonia pickettii TaxID=329 RepID=A0A7X2L8X3_RALPI|nr:spore coat U domain-containing protein [Ralstonia pickettii]MEE2979654.1 spore coat U domain-containing protein [Pseudomonadota bacterium]MRS97250.1 fimbrial major subunit CsuA/B family protein [Ralstonia pickettii]NWK46902.1 spore coat U domain-containing protein [Ralstonia pickettii]OCS44974.1 spore coat protein U [Ralstonia pickettii]WKZ87697.1 spore coat U domain-containing protein [Ralstonia pickettii]
MRYPLAYPRVPRLAPQLIVLAGLLSAPGWLGAATKTTTFTVSLTLQNDCSISANALNFGTQGVLSANVDQTTSLSVTCSTAAPYNVGLDAGTTTGSTIAARLLAGTGTATVGYQLYRDTARTQIWGNTVGTDTVTGTGTGTAQALTVYGRVPPQNTPAAGTYTSTVTATITF